MTPRGIATSDRAARLHNLGVVRHLAPRSRVMAAVKANGDGHGAIPVARALADKVMSLPMGPYLTDEDIRRVCAALLEAVDISEPAAMSV